MKTNNYKATVRKHLFRHAEADNGSPQQRWTLLLLAILTVFTMPAVLQAASPNIIQGDVITVAGGAASPANPDVYVIDGGVFTPGETYSFTLKRPKGAQANYAVSIEYAVVIPEYGSFEMKEGYDESGVLTFAAGETEKTIEFAAGTALQNSTADVYLFFGLGNRTQAQYPAVKMNFTNPNPVTPGTGGDYLGVETIAWMPIGSYMLMIVGDEYFGHFDVLDNTRLRIKRQRIDHEAYTASASDSFHAEAQTLLLKPEQPIGTQSNQLHFLYKMTEDAVIADYVRTVDGYQLAATPCFTRQADSLMNIRMAIDQTLFDKFYVEDPNQGMGDAMPVILDGYQYMEVPARFGAITADAASYDRGATIVLTIPVLNSKLLQKLYPNNEWIDHLDVTLDGGATFINHAYLTFDGVNNNIIAIAEAKNETSSPLTVTAEVLFRKIDPRAEDEYYMWLPRYYVYGTNAAFTVTARQAEFKAIESIDFVLPANNMVNLSLPNAALLAKVNPVAATFKTGTWASSDTEVADISVNGILTPKAYGKTTITFTSDEAGYRTANSLPANDGVLVRSFDIYVVGDFPAWGISGGYEYDKMMYEPEYCRFSLNHNLKNNAWKVDGEVAVEVIHSESDKYPSITDAFEVTPEMIDGDAWGGVALKYTVPFNEKTFPKNVTVYEAFMADSIMAPPYRLVMSLPLKQSIGGAEMTHVLRDTFDVHLTLPRQPVVRLIQGSPAEMMSGETMLLKYEIKYLDKVHRGAGDNYGFEVYMSKGRNGYSTYEGYEGHPYFSETFRCPNDERYRTYLTSKGAAWSPASEAPEWLELTDMGYYYNAVATIRYELPAPLGAVKDEYNREYYEEFYGSIRVENKTGFLTNDHPLFGEIMYVTSNSYHEYKTVKAYTVDLELMDKKSAHTVVGKTGIPLTDWDEEGYRMSEIIGLADEGNQSGDYSAFKEYMKKKSGKSITNIYSPTSWGELVAGITRAGSNDTIYTMVEKNQLLDVLYPFSGGDFDLVLRYPRHGKVKSYHYSTDSITGQVYSLSFGLSRPANYNYGTTAPTRISANYPIEISYMNGDSVQVDIVKPANTGLEYIICEPKGIIGNVSYKQYYETGHKWLSGAVTPTSIGEGTASAVTMSATTSTIGSLFSYAAKTSATNLCFNTEMEFIPVTLLDEDTGARITANARIHYAGEKGGKAQFFEDEQLTLVTVEQFKQFLQDEYMNVCSHITCDIQEERFGGTYENPDIITYRANTQEALDKVNRFFQSKLDEYVARHISSSADGYLPNSEYGTISEATRNSYLIPYIKVTDNGAGCGRTPAQYDLWSYPEYICYPDNPGVYMKWQKAHYVLDIVADGYYPKLVTFDPDPKLKAIGEAGLTVTLRKKTDALCQPDVKIWTEKVVPSGASFWKGTGVQYRYNGAFSVGGIFDYGAHDKQDLTVKGRNSITTFSHYAGTENAVLNITLPLEDGWTPESLLLHTDKGSAAPLNYTLVSPASYRGFETTYANLSYRLNDLIDYGNDEAGNPIAENTAYPDIKWGGVLVAEVPGLFNDEVDPAVYETKITQELIDNIRLSPGQFDVKSMTGAAKNGSNTDKAMQRAEEFNFSMPDPIPFEFQTRTEGNRYYLRGIASHNFIDDIPLVGQANMAMSLASRANEFDAAFTELKGAIKMRPKNGTPRMSTLNTFAGLRGYLEGYGEYDPLTHSYEYGINEGGVSVELSASAYVKVPLGLVNVGVGVDGVVSATMGMNKPADEDWVRRVNKAKFDLWLETQLSLDVRADVSAGLDIGIAGVEVGVTGRAGFKNMNKMVLKPYLPAGDNQFFSAGGYFNVYANMYAWAHAYFLFWSWEDEWKIFDANKTWYYPNNSNNPYLRAGGAPRVRSLAQAYRSNTADVPNTIINNVAANAYPRYFGNGGSLMFSNLKSSTNQNDDRVSIYASGSTSDMLPAATLPAFGFDVATAANGVSVAAYEQMTDSIRPKADKVSQETYIKTQTNNVNVFAAVKNGGDWQTTRLSNAGTADMAPKTAVSPDGTTAAVIWRSGYAKIDEAGAKIVGNLQLSRYNGTKWSDKPIDLGSADNLADYSLAIDGDSIVIAGMRMGTDSVGKIKLIYVSAKDSVTHIETGRTGRKPQIVRAGDHYFVGFMGQYAKNDTTNVNDMYLLATRKNGLAIDSLSGFAGMDNKVSFAYKLLSEPNAKNIGDLAILYNASKVIDDNEVQTSLYASKFGRLNGKIFASNAQKLLTAPNEQLIMSFDGYKSGGSLQAAAVISNSNHGAVVVEETATFENKINCLSEAFNTAEIKQGQTMPVEFEIQNAGFSPLTSLAVSINGGETTTVNYGSMPGEIQLIRGNYKIPVNNTAPAPYSITAAFADGSTNTVNGTIDLTAYLMKVNLVSLKTTNAKNTAVVEIVNNSSSPLTAQHQVTVGIYSDMFGEALYPGTVLKTIPISELYGDNGIGTTAAKIATTAFDIPLTDEIKSVYAIAKVKKTTPQTVQGQRAMAAESSEEVEQAENNYASIRLFPVKGGLVTKKPEDAIQKTDGLRIYPNPVKNVLHIDSDKPVGIVSLYTISGMLVLRETRYDGNGINVSTLPEGIYIVDVDSYRAKMIKE